MIVVSVKNDIKEVQKRLANFDSRQMPFVVAKALTATAQDAKKKLYDEMPKAFDRPTPYTLNSLYVAPATKAKLEATVKLKDDTFKGTPANKYLAPEIFGGSRHIKRVERLLSARGILPAGLSVVPGSGAPLDQYGNIQRGVYSKILSQLKASSDQYQNESKASRARNARRTKGRQQGRYFVGKPGGGKLPLGVWERTSFAHGSAIKPVLLFVHVPAYRKRYDFFGIVQKTIQDRFAYNLTDAMQYAMETSR